MTELAVRTSNAAPQVAHGGEQMNVHARWFGRAMWLGILADWVLAVPAIFAPEWTMTIFRLRPTADPVWTAFAGLLLFLLSLFYIPAATNPYRYRFNAWMAVFARIPGVIFFLLLNPGIYPAFGLADGSLFVIQLPLLLLAMRHRPAQPWRPPDTLQARADDRSAIWLKRTLWLGILADWILGVPAIFAPERVLAVMDFRPVQDPVWASFAALLLVLLGVFYVPGANRPYEYRANAWLAVIARPPGVIFFLLFWRGYYPAFGLLDGFLFLIEFPFLIKTLQLIPERRIRDIDSFEYHGTTYAAVKEAAFSGPYTELPYHKGVGLSTFLQLINDSTRNMHDRRDIRPHYDKLIHANGICYAGIWEIDRPSPYTGYFAKGSRGLLIARASVAGIFIKQGARRALGIGGKIFPTLDPNQWVWPGNFVAVSHLSGSRAKHILDIEMFNYPSIGLDPTANLINRVIFRLVDTRPGYRQVYPISTLGLKPGDPVVTPDLMMLKVADGTPRVDAKDFRDEMRLRNYPGGRLVYDILVKSFDVGPWTRLGSLTFTEDVISEGSDKRLHFWIPRDLPNLPQRV
jgi:hypothetical protein